MELQLTGNIPKISLFRGEGKQTMTLNYKGNGLCGPTQYICTAKRTTPGPKYFLPTLTGYEGHDTEANKPRAPAYSLRIQFKNGDKYKSPGPAAYLPKQTRTGGDSGPAFSLSNRHKDFTKHIGPGPGAYAPEKHYYPPSRFPPEYSIGRKLKGRQHDALHNPAPNAYSLPSRIGTMHPDLKKSPAYFLTFRNKRGGITDDFNKTPGPAAYPVVDQNKTKLAAPEYSMRARTQLTGDKTIKPGPASHRPENCPHTAYSYKKGAPAFSFGSRHNEYAVSPIFADCEMVC